MNLALAIMSPILVQRKLEVQLRVPQVGTGHWEQPQEPTAKTCFRRSKRRSYSEVAHCQENALYKLYLSLSVYISVQKLQILLLTVATVSSQDRLSRPELHRWGSRPSARLFVASHLEPR